MVGALPEGGNRNYEVVALAYAIYGRVTQQKKAQPIGCAAWWREEDSNLRPLGYEPNELPLLHPAICECKVTHKFRKTQV